jgi:hypothetical protein
VGGITGNASNNEGTITINRVYTANTVRNTGAWYQNTTGGFIGRYNAWYGGVKYNNCFAINDTIDGLNQESTGRLVGGTVDQSKSSVNTLYHFADNAFALAVMEYNESETADYRRILPSETGEDGAGEEYQLLNRRNEHGFNITAASLKTQTTYEDSGWDFSETWTLGNGDYPLPVLKKISAAKQPSAYPAYLDAKPVYSVTLTLDSTGVTDFLSAPISLHSAFPYWVKNGIIEGTDVPVYIRPETGTELESLLVNDVDKTSEIVNNLYTIREIAANILVIGKFKLSEENGIENTPAGSIRIYPNPTAGKLSVSNNAGNSTVRIYDITGNERLKSNESTLDISHFAAGVYFVKVAGRVTKIVKK